jgi:hypothetical protein
MADLAEGIAWSNRIVACLSAMNDLVEKAEVTQRESEILAAFITDGLYIQEGIAKAGAGELEWDDKWQAACEDYVVRMENMLDRIKGV